MRSSGLPVFWACVWTSTGSIRQISRCRRCSRSRYGLVVESIASATRTSGTLVTAVLHQRTRHADQRNTYRWLCETYGSRVPTADGPALLLPTAERMAALPSTATARLNSGRRRCSLVAVAAAYLEQRARWASLPPAQLVTELQAIRGIGPWTAGLAVADHTHDYSLLPFADFAISTWATKFLTTNNQPLEETEFARMWRRAQGHQLSMLALLTIAWGIHHAGGLPLWTNSQQP